MSPADQIFESLQYHSSENFFVSQDFDLFKLFYTPATLNFEERSFYLKKYLEMKNNNKGVVFQIKNA